MLTECSLIKGWTKGKVRGRHRGKCQTSLFVKILANSQVTFSKTESEHHPRLSLEDTMNSNYLGLP
jgi:hypothetical protein